MDVCRWVGARSTLYLSLTWFRVPSRNSNSAEILQYIDRSISYLFPGSTGVEKQTPLFPRVGHLAFPILLLTCSQSRHFVPRRRLAGTSSQLALWAQRPPSRREWNPSTTPWWGDLEALGCVQVRLRLLRRYSFFYRTRMAPLHQAISVRLARTLCLDDGESKVITGWVYEGDVDKDWTVKV